MWEEPKLEVSESQYEGWTPTPIPTEAMLQQFETDHAFSLPQSYREFVKKYGAGEIAGLYRIASPMPIECRHELAEYNRSTHGRPEEQLLAIWGFGEKTQQCYFFGDCGGDMFAWLLTEITDAQANEYAIYAFLDSTRVERLADNFFDFVTAYVLSKDKKRNWTPEYTFSRFQVRV